MISRFYDPSELKEMGIDAGENVLIARTCIIPEPERLKIGSNSRIDDFSIITGDVKIGRYTHIAHYVHLSGHYGITIGDFVGVGSRTTIYTEADDYRHPVIGPQIPYELRITHKNPVELHNFVAIGIGCFIFPGSILMTGASLNIRSNARGRFPRWCEYVSKEPNLTAEYKRERSYPQEKWSQIKKIEKDLECKILE